MKMLTNNYIRDGSEVVSSIKRNDMMGWNIKGVLKKQKK